jgi:hypothetical protein
MLNVVVVEHHGFSGKITPQLRLCADTEINPRKVIALLHFLAAEIELELVDLENPNWSVCMDESEAAIRLVLEASEVADGMSLLRTVVNEDLLKYYCDVVGI